MSSSPAEIGIRIKEVRTTAGMSQTELATYLGKTLRTVQKYEKGEIEPSISVLNLIADRLNVSPAYLAGYQEDKIRINSLPDVLSSFYQLYRKDGIRYFIRVKKPPQSEDWRCSIEFIGNDETAEHNADLCLFLEEFAEEIQRVETYWTEPESLDHWIRRELAYYAQVTLEDREIEQLTYEERIQRRDAIMVRQVLEQKKTAGNTDDQ